MRIRKNTYDGYRGIIVPTQGFEEQAFLDRFEAALRARFDPG